jgi:hypothetical protein
MTLRLSLKFPGVEIEGSVDALIRRDELASRPLIIESNTQVSSLYEAQ